ncbi:MAG: hypothetical protein ACYTFH_04370 [Planctomycetota bacterium]|jgi:Kef-type K+ transport system membrane component KefB
MVGALLLAADAAPVPDAPAGGVPIGFRIFLAVLALGGLAIAAGTPFSRRLHRNRAVAALSAGGWFAVLAGLGVGPAGLDLVDERIFAELRPLVVVSLGWVGLIVGLQARWRILQAVPRVVWSWTLEDAAMSALVAAAIGAIVYGLSIEHGFAHPVALIAPLATLAAANLSWAPETRSLRVELSDRTRRIATLVAAAAGLSAILAIAVAGLATLPIRADGIASSLDPLLGLKRFGILVATALVVGAGARVLLSIVERDSPQMLVVVVGLVCIVAGVADAAGISPLLSGLLAGVVIANLSTGPLRNLESVLHRGETAGGMLLYGFAGVLVATEPGWATIALGFAIAATRILLKPASLRRSMRIAGEELPAATPLRLASVRQAPLAVAVVIALILVEDSTLARTLLTAIVIAGFASGLAAPLQSWQRRTVSGGSSGRNARPAEPAP